MDRPGRYNVERSCLRCHQRKVRCDKGSPCGSCVRANTSCQYPGPNRVKRRAPKVAHTDVMARLESLERSIAALSGNRPPPHVDSAAVSRNNASVPVAPSPSSNGVSPTDTTDQRAHDGLLVEDGRYINEQLLSRVLENEKELQSAIGTPRSDASSSRRPPALKAEGLLVTCFLDKADFQALHPCQWQATQLWQAFLNHIDPVIKLLHVPSTQPRIFAAINRPQDAPADLHALLFAIYFAATTSMLAEDPTHEEKRLEVCRYQRGLELALHHSNFLDSPTLTSLQAISIYQVCLRYYNSGRSGWTLRGLVIRAAQSIGLHRDGKHFKLTPLECELRRRLWWHLCSADSRAVEDHGVGVTGGGEFYDTEYPANIDDQNLPATATVPPEPQARWTEMTVSLITTIANQKRLELHSALTNSVPGKRPAELVQEVKDHICDGYLRHGDPNIPIQRHGMLLGEILVVKMEMYVHQRALQAQSTTMPIAERREMQERTLDVACQALERTNELFTDELLRGYRWLSSTYMPYFILTYMLWHLCVYPTGFHVERAWRGVNLTFEMTKDPSWPDPGPKWAIIIRLRDKALHIRRAQVAAEQAAQSVETPPPGVDQGEVPAVESFFDFVNWDMGMIGFPDWTGLMQSVDITGFEHLMDGHMVTEY
ncbi:C6 transcription factor [Aspergillus sclerotiicarbonarius CBS 121057]|uniref:C6 transcription factor n=1 Tax=Aspergillus sclerotiicarbonarius (strain CBS 121057 / IBT 28362) TaxID=1448318 RepID=A0A319DVS0_ASPSB|nr:C6 transcription factor [Aspergillus sclerotiicarbonarius CBS 121057]